MSRPGSTPAFPICPRCGATAHLRGARFCGQCGAALNQSTADLPVWQKPAPAKYHHIVMSRRAMSCPECGYPMMWGFKKVCRQCGAQLVMVPSILHPYHMRVFVRGPSAALYTLAGELLWLAAGLAVLAAIGNALK